MPANKEPVAKTTKKKYVLKKPVFVPGFGKLEGEQSQKFVDNLRKNKHNKPSYTAILNLIVEVDA